MNNSLLLLTKGYFKSLYFRQIQEGSRLAVAGAWGREEAGIMAARCGASLGAGPNETIGVVAAYPWKNTPKSFS